MYRRGYKMSKPSERSVGKDVGVDAGDQDLHFFKLMFGDFRERITIPDAFVKHFRGELARTITLESRSGLTFDVEITGNSEKLVLHSGWDAFASAHDLKMGDFLLFKYNGISQLKVLIFDPTGCEKALPCLLMNSPQSESSNQGNEIVNISSPSRSSGCISSSEDDQQAHPARRLILVRGTCPTGSQKKKLKVKIRDIYSEIPIFGCTIRMSNIHGKPCTLQICREYAEVYLPFEDETIVLRRHGKIWKVRCCISQYGSKRLLKGWMQFARRNNLRLGDICLFKLLKNKKKYTMDVHIIRKA